MARRGKATRSRRSKTVQIDGYTYPTRVTSTDAGRTAPLIDMPDRGIRWADDTDTPPSGS